MTTMSVLQSQTVFASYVVDEDFVSSLGAMLDAIAKESGRNVLRLEKIGGNK